MTRRAFVFIGLTYLASFALVAVYSVMGGNWKMPGSLILSVAYMFMPMTVALVLQKGVYREPVIEPLAVSFRWNRWFWAAWLLPTGLAFVTLGISLLLPGVRYSPEMEGMFERFRALFTPEQLEQMRRQTQALPIHPIWLALAQGLVAGISINAVAGFGEELGWRGFLQKETAKLGFWKSSAIIGLVWGLWHAPLIWHGHNYPQHPKFGVFMMTAWTMLLAPIFSYVRLRSGSVIAAAILHGSLNASAGLAIMVVAGGNDLLVGITGLAGFIVLALANLGLWVYDRYGAESPIMD